MKVTPIPHNLDLTASDLVRSPGLHMSSIYGDLYKTLEPKRFGGDNVINPLMTAMGTAWENQLEYLIRKAGHDAHRPGEFRTKEGIAFSPDLLIYDDQFRLGEIKLKWWMLSRKFPRKPGESFSVNMNKDLTQMLSYCHALETPYARLYANCIQGTGKKPIQPELLAYDIEFTARELKEEWDMMMNHARHRRLL